MIARESVLLPLLLLVVLHFLPIQQAQLPDEASLMAIFVGRCNEFQLLRHPELFPQITNISRLTDEWYGLALRGRVVASQLQEHAHRQHDCDAEGDSLTAVWRHSECECRDGEQEDARKEQVRHVERRPSLKRSNAIKYFQVDVFKLVHSKDYRGFLNARNDQFRAKSSRKNCSRLWEEFRFVALQPDHCRPEPDDFAGLLQMANHEIPVDKFVFWSGTAYSLVIRVRDMPEYFPLEETLIGFIMNSMDWCNYRCDVNTRGSKISLRRRRSTNSQVTRRESCTNFTLPFWIAASSWFELPQLSPPRISQVDVYPLRSLNDPRLASAYSACRMDPSVLRLRQRLLLKGVRVNCQDNPLFLVHTLCSESPQAERCQLIGGQSRTRAGWPPGRCDSFCGPPLRWP
uniref:ADP-ribosyl cyclase/cyclic ADP-ribose hydrolase n=1 Tax=Macrostomum lignano TaxID=282301 RepID=A0A1I8JS25_9PLAT